jgi:hypothetical protein
MSFSNRRWVIFNVSELSNIDFSQVLETSSSSVRKSNDGTLTFVKYDGSMPSTVSALITKTSEYDYAGINAVLLESNWFKTI